MENSLTDNDWELLIERIKDQQCTPFLGAGMCCGVLPLGKDVAQEWSQKFGYPMDDPYDLVKVAQFLALVRDPVMPKEEFLRMIKKYSHPNYSDSAEPHSILASLRLPVYITTNYDDFMFQALVYRDRDARREMCRWNKYTQNHPSIFEQDPGYKPTIANPLIFHLHGSDELASSLVLTEDDYMDFLVNMLFDQQLLPAIIRQALTETSLLFIGYRIVDWNFRVVMQSFRRLMERSSARTNFAVMPLPDTDDEARRKIQQHLTRFYENIDVKVYWGTAQEFLAELLNRAGTSLRRLQSHP